MPKSLVRCRAVCLAALLSAPLFTFAPAARAVVVRGGPTANQASPAQGHVGRWNGSSAVAVGQHWMLTARHTRGDVGGQVLIDGQRTVATALHRHARADLMLIRTRDALTDWHAITADAALNDHVVVAGLGRTGGVAIGAAASSTGYDWTGRYAETWGENRVESLARGQIGMRYDVGPRALMREAGLAINDSGGGVFTVNADAEYELVGINASTSSFGRTVAGSWSYAIDLRPHLAWLRGIIGAEADFALRASPGSADKGPNNVPAPAGMALVFVVAAVSGVARWRR